MVLILKRIGKGACWGNQFSVLQQVIGIAHDLYAEISFIAPVDKTVREEVGRKNPCASNGKGMFNRCDKMIQITPK